MLSSSHANRGTGVLLIALAALFGGPSGCTAETGCFSDSECGSGKICQGGSCITGERTGPGDFDFFGDPNAGDPYGADIDVAGDFGPQYDQQGPTIRILTPRAYELVQNIITISVEANDPDGVDPDSVYAIVADQYAIPLTPDEGSQTYIAPWDTDNVGRMVFPTIVVTATDLGGNTNSVGSIFSLDNSPPQMSFDSRPLIMQRFGPGGAECTAPFSLLGENTLRNGDVIDSSYFYHLGMFPRLRIQDRGNEDTIRNLEVPVFGVDNRTTFLYTADSNATGATGNTTTRKLLLGNGPGTPCSRINPDLLPDPLIPDAADKAIVTWLDHRGDKFGSPTTEALPKGMPNFTIPLVPAPLPPECNRFGLLIPCVLNCCHHPRILCSAASEPATYYPCYSGPQNPDSLISECHPLVYGPAEFGINTRLVCANGPFDGLNWLQDGIVCLTASAADTRQNLGFAAPIAICIDKDDSGNCGGFVPNPLTQCSDGCTPVPGWGSASDPPQVEYWEEGEDLNIYNKCYD